MQEFPSPIGRGGRDRHRRPPGCDRGAPRRLQLARPVAPAERRGLKAGAAQGGAVFYRGTAGGVPPQPARHAMVRARQVIAQQGGALARRARRQVESPTEATFRASKRKHAFPLTDNFTCRAGQRHRKAHEEGHSKQQCGAPEWTGFFDARRRTKGGGCGASVGVASWRSRAPAAKGLQTESIGGGPGPGETRLPHALRKNSWPPRPTISELGHGQAGLPRPRFGVAG